MIYRIAKWIIVLLLAAAIGLLILNREYFFKQIRYHLNRTFVTEQQRQNMLREKPIPTEANQLQIPSLQIVAPIQYVAENSEAAFQTALASGVVHYPGTAGPGKEGNSYIFGHSSDYAFSPGQYKTVFALLPKIELGAEIIVSDQNGSSFTYKVYEKFVTESDDLNQLNQETLGKRILTLQTSYPIGTALRRYIVKAELSE